MPARQDISEWDSDSESRLAGRPSAVGKAGETKTPLSDRRELPRFSIVVLPFVNIGGDSEQGYFADGVTDSLTTDLSRIRGAFVIGSRTAFTHKGKAADVRQIGRDLNVCYALQGSVQRSANCMRINVQLVDAETGNHLWAERFEKPVADLFDMQDEIVSRLAGALNTELIAAEVRRAEKASNPDSMDLYFQGLAWFNKGVIPENVAQARSFFDCALAVDPDNVEALVGSARGRTRGGAFFCGRSHGGRRGGRSEIDQSVVFGPGPCARPHDAGVCVHLQQARRTGHRRMRACDSAGSKSCRSPFGYRIRQYFHRPRRRNRGSRW
jgi:TolB-like protein